MANTMRAAVVHAFRAPLRIEEVPIPVPGPGEVLIKVVATGVCHTDLHAADSDWHVAGHRAPSTASATLPTDTLGKRESLRQHRDINSTGAG